MKKSFYLGLLACLACLFSVAISHAAPADGLKLVFTLDSSNPGASGAVAGSLPKIHEFPKNLITQEAEKNLKVFFDDSLKFRLTGADPQAKYTVRATFLSDKGRTLEFLSTDEIVEDGIILPDGKQLTKEWLLPASSYTQTQGVLILQLNATAGSNAVLQKLEVFSDNPQKLTLEANPPKQPFVLDVAELDRVVAATPIPRISPRPVSVSGVAKPILSLNGTWKFAPTGTASADSKNIEVPGEWAMQGFDVPKRAFAEYFRSFEVPADWAGKSIRLRFDAVHAVCKIFVNGKEIGGHEGGFIPFELDATHAIKVGANNEIRVQAQSESIADSIACMSQYAAHQVGGIVRKVTIFALPKAHIAKQNWAVKFDGNFKDATLEVSTDLSGVEKGDASEIRHELIDSTGTVVATWGIDLLRTWKTVHLPDGTVVATWGTDPIGTSRSSSQVIVKSPKHWTSETPNLYTLKTTLLTKGSSSDEKAKLLAKGSSGDEKVKLLAKGSSGDEKVKLPTKDGSSDEKIKLATVVETISQRIGFRQIEIKGNIYLVNGKPVKLLGACRHEVHPLRGRSLTPELCRQDALLFREGNCNFIRTSHYPPSEEFLDACDELGLFVESEAAVTWIKHHASPVWKTWNHLDPKYLPYFLRASYDNVVANQNHPSIIQWSIANESLWTPLWDKVNKAVKALDPTRPTAFHDQCWGGFNNGGNTADVANYHYPSENDPNLWSKEARPVIFGEYVHLQCYNRRELATDPFIREDWGRPTARMVDLMWEQPGLVGASIWSGMDDVFHMPNGELRGYGHWGPIDGWRRKKPEWFGMKKAYTPVKIFNVEETPRVVDGTVSLDIQNRFNFTNLNNVNIAWKAGEKSGTVSANLAPHAKGKITIPVGEKKPGEFLEITVTGPQGMVCEQEKIRLCTLMPFVAQPKLQSEKAIQEIAAQIAKLPVDLMILPLNGSGGASGPAGSVLTNNIEPFTPVCQNGKKLDGIATSGTEISIIKSANYDEAQGAIGYIAHANREVEVNYSFTLKQDIDPRQWGLVFTLPRSFDTLTWKSKGTWTSTPNNSIGRSLGTAKANPVVRNVVEEIGKDLSGTDWSQDANALGTNDFRSTKANILEASLSDGKKAFTVKSLGQISTRAWIEENNVKLLITGYNTGGSDGFFNSHYSAERRPLKKGDKIEGRFSIEITK